MSAAVGGGNRISGTDRDSIDLLEFYREWEPFGGGRAEDIWVNFGLSPAEYRRRLEATLVDHRLDGYWRDHLALRSRLLRAVRGTDRCPQG